MMAFENSNTQLNNSIQEKKNTGVQLKNSRNTTEEGGIHRNPELGKKTQTGSRTLAISIQVGHQVKTLFKTRKQQEMGNVYVNCFLIDLVLA